EVRLVVMNDAEGFRIDAAPLAARRARRVHDALRAGGVPAHAFLPPERWPPPGAQIDVLVSAPAGDCGRPARAPDCARAPGRPGCLEDHGNHPSRRGRRRGRMMRPRTPPGFFTVDELLLLANLLSALRLPLAAAFPFAARTRGSALVVLGLAGLTDVLD